MVDGWAGESFSSVDADEQRWRAASYFLVIVGASRWTGTEQYLGTDMFWDHADTASYLRWLAEAQLTPIWDRYIPEGDSGHSLILAQAT